MNPTGENVCQPHYTAVWEAIIGVQMHVEWSVFAIGLLSISYEKRKSGTDNISSLPAGWLTLYTNPVT